MRKTASGYRLIFGYLGLFITFVGVATLLPLLALFFYPEEAGDWYCFAIPGGGAIILGIALFLLIANRIKAQLGKFQDSILLVLIWVCAIFISAVPLFIKGGISFTDAMFETTSAYATVGLTVFPKSFYGLHMFILYRSILCFIGGIGLVLIITSAISDRYGLKLYLAEGHSDKLMPHLGRSARLILTIYSSFVLLGILLYWAAGMSFFDAIVHSISAVATAGFSSKYQGLMAYAGQPNWWLIQAISVLLMVLGATNFLLALFLFTGRFKRVFKDCEIRFFGILCLIFIPLFVLSAFFSGKDLSFGKAFTQGSFTFISSITTTGFANVSDMKTLGQGVILLVTLMNIIGGGMGSTSGGVKQYRMIIALKSFYWSTKESTASQNTIYPHYVYRFGDQKEINEREIASSFSYILLYVALLFAGSLLVAVFNKGASSFGDSMFEFSNALACTGLSVGLTSAATTTIGAKWTLIVGMFAGRLEIIVIYFAFFRSIRDLFGKETI